MLDGFGKPSREFELSLADCEHSRDHPSLDIVTEELRLAVECERETQVLLLDFIHHEDGRDA